MARFILVLVALLLCAPVAAEALGCWCDPRTPSLSNQCRDDWVVYELGSGHNRTVCNGAPPGTGGDIFVAPHDCPELALAIAGANGTHWPSGHTQGPNGYNRGQGPLPPVTTTFALSPGPFNSPCIAIPNFPPPIAIWPSLPPNSPKPSLARSVNVQANYIVWLQQRILALGGAGDPRARSLVMALANAMAGLAKVLQAFTDPANPNYAQVPPPLVLAPHVPLVADATLTAAQAAAFNAWSLAYRQVITALDDFNRTLDSASGAILAGPTDPVARAWASTHATAIDGLGNRVAAAGAAEVAARAAVAAAHPSTPVPAYCITAADIASHMPRVFGAAYGADAVSMRLYHLHALTNPCVPATTWPAFFVADTADLLAGYAAFQDVGYAATVCAATGYCGASLDIGASPLSLAFGSLAVGATSAVQTVTVRNDGTAALVIGPLALTGGGGATHFRKKASLDLCTGITLAPAGTCTVGIRFVPASVGLKQAGLLIPSNATTTPARVDLRGTGTVAMGVSPGALAFGAWPVSASGPTAMQLVTVRNDGAVALTLGTLALGGAATQFTKKPATDFCSTVTLAPGATCTVGIRFKPTSVGPKSATLSIPSPTSPTVTVTLSGTGS